jgi:hypothetical protein
MKEKIYKKNITRAGVDMLLIIVLKDDCSDDAFVHEVTAVTTARRLDNDMLPKFHVSLLANAKTIISITDQCEQRLVDIVKLSETQTPDFGLAESEVLSMGFTQYVE